MVGGLHEADCVTHVHACAGVGADGWCASVSDKGADSVLVRRFVFWVGHAEQGAA